MPVKTFPRKATGAGAGAAVPRPQPLKPVPEIVDPNPLFDPDPDPDTDPDTDPDESEPNYEPADSADSSDCAMTLTQDDINRLSSIVGKNILTRDDLISQVTFLTCVSVQGISITLEPGLLSRMKSRCFKEEFPVFLKRVITKQLFDFAGW